MGSDGWGHRRMADGWQTDGVRSFLLQTDGVKTDGVRSFLLPRNIEP